MAKLSARGRTEIYRLERDGQKMALMSDQNILWNAGWGWKQFRKLRDGVTPEAWLQHKQVNGWKIIHR